MNQLAKNAIAAVFLPAEEKQRVMEEFDAFVAAQVAPHLTVI